MGWEFRLFFPLRWPPGARRPTPCPYPGVMLPALPLPRPCPPGFASQDFTLGSITFLTRLPGVSTSVDTHVALSISADARVKGHSKKGAALEVQVRPRRAGRVRMATSPPLARRAHRPACLRCSPLLVSLRDCPLVLPRGGSVDDAARYCLNPVFAARVPQVRRHMTFTGIENWDTVSTVAANERELTSFLHAHGVDGVEPPLTQVCGQWAHVLPPLLCVTSPLCRW